MVNYLDKVKQFHEIFGQEINDHKDQISLKTRQLRLKLIFEELYETALAAGVGETFYNLSNKVVSDNSKTVNYGSGYKEEYIGVKDTDDVSKVQELDGLSDLLYVLFGSILSLGYQEIIEYAFLEVHRSNLSKTCKNLKEVEDTIKYYTSQDQECYSKQIDENLWIVYRTSDNKVLKNVNYSPADLESIYKFFTLKDRWNKETIILSYTDKKNPLYSEIVNMGKKILPIIFYDINKNMYSDTGTIWVPFILDIVGPDVIHIPDIARGRIKLLHEICLDWGHKNGYCDLFELNKYKYLSL